MNIEKSINVGFKIFKKRKKALARHTDVTQSAVSCWCSGKSTPTVGTLEKIADFFGVKVSTFIKWGEEE